MVEIWVSVPGKCETIVPHHMVNMMGLLLVCSFISMLSLFYTPPKCHSIYPWSEKALHVIMAMSGQPLAYHDVTVIVAPSIRKLFD